MIAKSLAEMWTALAPAVGDHLWQSTVVALAAALTTVALRKNHARTRYWVWLVASLKFVLPFSLLVSLAGYLPRTWTSARTTSQLYLVMDEAGQPFTQPTIPLHPARSSAASPSLAHVLPVLLAAVWLSGFALVLATWCVRWRKTSAAIRAATPLHEGREVDALRRMERVAGIRKPIDILLSPASLEPGIFGIARPVLLWPAEISQHLDDAHLESILAHEVWHVRRRDNLAASVHMLVEAIFWFHPLVWWLGARLVDERERACDEEVLRLGSEPAVYAESILKTCQLCVESRLACVSGVTGADLKRRITHIMTRSAPRKLDLGRKLLIGVVGLAVVATPVMFGLLSATRGQAESGAEDSASVMPVLAPLPTGQEQSVPTAAKPTTPKKKACSKSKNKSKSISSSKDTVQNEH